MPTSSHAVFLSYASEDAPAAQRVAQGLRAAGIEVWFDQTELRGGDAWDRQIRKQIHDCALFIPVISAHSQARLEGYFRREWKLAADRTHDMAEEKAFLVPVVIDDTSERSASVPEKFRDVQWTHLPRGETSSAFVERVSGLLSPDRSPARPVSATASPRNPPKVHRPPRWRLGLVVGLIAATVLAVAYLGVHGFWVSKPGPAQDQSARTAALSGTGAQSIPEKSIAVLPFEDMSEKHDQEYFADGMAEEIIGRLAKIHGLRVSARSSSFYFRGKNERIAAIAKELGVVHILEGSVRKAGEHLRVTAELVRAGDGAQIWSETYDRELKDVFAVQDQIAGSVASALRLALGGATLSAEHGGTTNLEAYQWYLRGRSSLYENGPRSLQAAGEQLQEALRLDPNFALAASRLAQVYLLEVNNRLLTPKEGFALTRAQAQRALLIDPDLAEPHLWLGYVDRTLDWNWDAAAAEFQRVLVADPANVDAMMFSGTLYKTLAQWSQGEKVLRRAMELDPLNTYVLFNLGELLYLSRRFPEAEELFRRLRVSSPTFQWTRPRLAMTLLAEKRPREALALFEEGGPSEPFNPWPSVLLANGRTAEADRSLHELMVATPIANAYYVAVNLAYRNDADQAFQWLEKAYSQREPQLIADMTNEPFFDSIRHDPRYSALRHKLNLSE